MTRWIAPILSFTAEEVWAFLPGASGTTVFASEWHEFPVEVRQAGPETEPIDWDAVLGVRAAVSREIERQRNAGTLGGSLEAEVALWLEPKLAAKLAALGDELRFALIVSSAMVAPPGTEASDALSDGEVRLKVVSSAHPKCVRCWHRRVDVGALATHPGLCARCVANVVGPGEERRFA
jgi:isoleucyl-tRNA synthetase